MGKWNKVEYIEILTRSYPNFGGGGGASPFDGEYGGKAKTTEGKTDNLLDYGRGTHLAKWQWDELFDPALLVSPFEGDEDAMMPIIDDEKLYAYLEEIRQSLATGTDVHVRRYQVSSKDEITVGGYNYHFITIKMMSTTKQTLSIKGSNPELFTENNIWGVEQYCIGYSNKAITIVLSTREDREKLLSYLSANRSNSYLLFVSGYNFLDEFKDFVNKNENKETNETWLDDIIGFVKKTPVAYDSKEYWGNEFVDAMVTRLRPKKITYMAGHDNIGTSNHKIIGNFLYSIQSSLSARYDITSPLCYHNPSCVKLNSEANVSGFNQRRNNGKQRGVDYVNLLKSECVKGTDGLVHDTVDIVCHSMGFAHALGIIDVMKEAMKTDLKGLKLGRFYIIAPENACSGEVNINEWEDVWQYGTNEATTPLWLQDGVAPQCAVKGFGDDQRAYIPSDVPQGFLKSHSIENYGWIFKIQPNQKERSKGYVTPRK
jgi:hypothetical protein